MTVTYKQLERAAFWDHEICLECGTEREPSDEPEPCEECASASIMHAGRVLAILALVERDEEDDGD